MHVADGVGVLSFNRPEKHNALSDELLATWRGALGEMLADTEVRCVVLRGEGMSFSSGRDTTQLGRRPTGESDFAFILREQREALRLRRANKPIVAALKGWVLGGAFELAVHADLRVASTDARLGLPEVRYGILPDVGGIAVLHALAGPERTKRLVMTGEPIDAVTALAWGIVSEVVAPDDLDDAALALARTLAAGSPTAVQRAKELVDALTDAEVDREVARELRSQVELFASRARSQRAADLIAESTAPAIEAAAEDPVVAVMDERFWDARYRSAPMIWSGTPNPHLVSDAADLAPGSALDVGAGEGADAIWLAQRGWDVTAVDISTVALERGRRQADALGAATAQRITWMQADLTEWEPPVATFDLVSVQFMHLPSGQRLPLFQRAIDAVAPGGVLLIVGHHPSDLDTTARRPAVPDLFFTADDLANGLGPGWTILAKDARSRTASDPTGEPITVHDTVLAARRAG